MKTLSRLLFSFPLVFGLVSAAASQPPADVTSAGRNALEKGAWALQFEIVQGSQNFTLQPFQGLLISAKHHWSDRHAVRLGLDLSASLINSDNSRSFRESTQVQTSDGERNENAQGAGVSVQYLAYPRPDATVNLYFGLGPSFRFSRAHSETSSRSGPPNQGIVNTLNRHLWAPGASGVLGVEWFAVRWLSLLGEYGAVAEYFSQRDTDEEIIPNPTRHSESILTQHGFRFAATRMKLGLSIYF